MPNTTHVQVDVRNLPQMLLFIRTVAEIAGTTNDPNTATNLRVALDKLYGTNRSQPSVGAKRLGPGKE